MLKIYKNFKDYFKLKKLHKLFWDEISNNNKLIEFLKKNNFGVEETSGTIIFYKINIVDNTLQIFSDELDIKNEIENQHSEIVFHNLELDSQFDLEKYLDFEVDVINYNLLTVALEPFQTITGMKFHMPTIKKYITNNLIKNESVENVINENEIYVYFIYFYFNKFQELKELKRKINITIITTTILLTLIVLVILKLL